MILYLGNTKNYTKRALEVINDFSKVSRCKSNVRKSGVYVILAFWEAEAGGS